MRDSKAVAKLLRILRLRPIDEAIAAKLEYLLFQPSTGTPSASEQLQRSFEMMKWHLEKNPTAANLAKFEHIVTLMDTKLAGMAGQTLAVAGSQMTQSVTSLDTGELKEAIRDAICQLKDAHAQLHQLDPQSSMDLQVQISYIMSAAHKLMDGGEFESAYILLVGLHTQIGDAFQEASGVFNPTEI